MAGKRACSLSKMMLGQVLNREVLKPSIINVRVIEHVFDSHYNMFFAHEFDFKAVERKDKVTPGDIVRITKLPEKLTVEVEHEVSDIVYPIGRMVDPVTGRRCRGAKFIDEESRQLESARVKESTPKYNYPL